MPAPSKWMPSIYLNPTRLTPATISVLSLAHRLAVSHGHNSVAGEHVLSALMNSPGRNVWSAGLVLDRLADQPRLLSYLSAVIPEEFSSDLSGNPPLAEPLEAALLLAADHSEANARQSVTTADLLVGIIGVQESISSAILLEAGLNDPSVLAEGITWASRNSLPMATANLNDATDTSGDLSLRLADLDDKDLRSLGGRLLRSLNSPARSTNLSAARRWIEAHAANAANPELRVGPLGATHPRSAHASMRVAYAIADRPSYLSGLIALAQSYWTWGRFGQATAIANAARCLMVDEFDDSALTLLEGELAPHRYPTGRVYGVPPSLAEAFGSTSAEQAWTLMLRFPQLLSPAGVAYAEDELGQPVARILAEFAHLGSWEVARELLLQERLSSPASMGISLNEGIANTATRIAMNYVEGLPADDSRSSVSDEKYSFSDFEFEPADDLGHEFRLRAAIALGHIISGDTSWNIGGYALQFAQYAQQQVETTKVDMEQLEFAVECFSVAVENTDIADPRYISRSIALSLALELRFALTRDIQAVESAAERLWDALYCCTPPDSSLGRLYYRLSELHSVPHSTLPGLTAIPVELSMAADDWPILTPEYDADILQYPAGIVQRFGRELRMPRLAKLLSELTDQNGQPKTLWAPESRPGRQWNQVAELAFDLATDPEDPSPRKEELFNTCEFARKLAIERATAVADEAAARFGLVELSLSRLSKPEPSDVELRALLAELQRCREHEDQLGPVRVRRLAEWSGDAYARLGETESAISEYAKALEIEEHIFSTQGALRHRIMSRSVEPSDIATRLSLIQCLEDPSGSANTLERGRALVFRALEDEAGIPKRDPFLPSCEASVYVPELFGRPLARSAYRSVAMLSRMGVRPEEPVVRPLAPSASSADIQRTLGDRGANLVFLVPGPSYGGVLIVPPEGPVVFEGLSGFSAGNLRRSLPVATAGDDTSYRMDEWYQRFQEGIGSDLWTRLDGILDYSKQLYMVSCGITAAFPWASCQQDPSRAVRYIASATHLVNSSRVQAPNNQTCEIVSAATSVGRHPLDYAEAEAASIEAKWAGLCRSARHRPNATVGECLSALAADVDVCHIVSHAAASERDPLQQGLALANGLVLTTEILRAQTRIGARLIILSSCNSGQAAFEVPNEFISLSSSLVAKGARGTIGNMWSIDDFTSCVMMEVLHDLLLQQSQHPAQAVARLQQAARARDGAFFADRAPLLRSEYVPEDFDIEELFAAASWAGLHYVGQ